MLPDLLLLLLLLFLSAFFSGSETAFFSLPREEIRRFREGKSRLDQAVFNLRSNSEDLLAPLLLCNMMVNVAFFIFSHVLAESGLREGYIQSRPLARVLIGLASLLAVIVFGEVTPKNIAVSSPVAFSRLSAFPLLFFRMLTHPFRKALQPLVRFLVRTVAPESRRESLITADELKMIVEMSAREGALDAETGKLMREVLDFRRLKVKEIITPRVDMVCYDLDGSREGFLQLVRETKHAVLPAYEGTRDNILGVLYTKDVFLQEKRSLRDLLRPLAFVPGQRRVEGLLREFQASGEEMVVVVDEYGGVDGLVTLEDILEEIVGEMEDEFDTPRELIKKTGKGRYVLAGSLSLREWGDLFGLKIEPTEADTVGGFVVSLLGHLPQVGEKARYRNFTFTVLATRRRRVLSLEMVQTQGKGS